MSTMAVRDPTGTAFKAALEQAQMEHAEAVHNSAEKRRVAASLDKEVERLARVIAALKDLIEGNG